MEYFIESSVLGRRQHTWTVGRVINGRKYPEFRRYARKAAALSALANLKVQDEQIAKAAGPKPFWWPNNLGAE